MSRLGKEKFETAILALDARRHAHTLARIYAHAQSLPLHANVPPNVH